MTSDLRGKETGTSCRLQGCLSGRLFAGVGDKGMLHGEEADYYAGKGMTGTT